jgi:serine/threonine protein kinase
MTRFPVIVLELIFKPGDGYERDEDHLAQCIELLGEFPKKVSQTGKYCRNYFTRKGELKHIHNLRFWPLKEVLCEKYRLAPADAESIAAFLVPCLELVPGKRATAASALQSAWLSEPVGVDGCASREVFFRVRFLFACENSVGVILLNC